MAITWGVVFILLIVIVLRKEHFDRKKPVLVGELIPGDRFGPSLKMSLAKSWWERIQEFIRAVLVSGMFIGIGWLLHGLTGMIYG